MSDEKEQSLLEKGPLDDNDFEQKLFQDWSDLAKDLPSASTTPWEPDSTVNNVIEEQSANGDSQMLPEPETNTEQKPIPAVADGKREEASEMESDSSHTAPSSALKALAVHKGTRILLSLILFICVSGVAVYCYKYWQKSTAAVMFIRKPIAIPVAEQQLKFMIMTNTQKEKALLSLVVGFGFLAVNAPELFQQNKLQIRDTVYQFVQQVSFAKATPSYWQPAIEKDLYGILRSRFHRCGIVSVRLIQLEEL